MAFSRYMPIETGSHTVTSAEATANTLSITLPTSCTGFIVHVTDSTGDTKTADAIITVSTTTLTVADGAATFNLVAGDIVHYICF